jgi:nucleoside-diphosphate-sugar epimerase
MSTGKNVFIIGPGLIGWTVLDLLVAENYKVTGLVRRQEHADGLKESGAEAVIGDLHDEELIVQHIAKNDIVFHTATADDLPRPSSAACERKSPATNPLPTSTLPAPHS